MLPPGADEVVVLDADGADVVVGDTQGYTELPDGLLETTADDVRLVAQVLESCNHEGGVGDCVPLVVLADRKDLLARRVDPGQPIAVHVLEIHLAVHGGVGEAAHLVASAGPLGQNVDAFDGGQGRVAVEEHVPERPPARRRLWSVVELHGVVIAG